MASHGYFARDEEEAQRTGLRTREQIDQLMHPSHTRYAVPVTEKRWANKDRRASATVLTWATDPTQAEWEAKLKREDAARRRLAQQSAAPTRATQERYDDWRDTLLELFPDYDPARLDELDVQVAAPPAQIARVHEGETPRPAKRLRAARKALRRAALRAQQPEAEPIQVRINGAWVTLTPGETIEETVARLAQTRTHARQTRTQKGTVK